MTKLKEAAKLSQSLAAAEIQQKLGISRRTLNRYVASAEWQQSGGKNPFGRQGRRKSRMNDWTLIRAISLYPACNFNWAAVARRMGIPVHRLHSIRRQRN